MRNTRVYNLVLLASVAAIGAGKPIPQDRALMEQRDRERLEWNRQTLVQAYDKVGKKNSRWDEPARGALDLAARMYSQQKDPVIITDNIHPLAKKAVDAGCGDPLILYVYARTSVGPFDPGPAEYARRTIAAADAMEASFYPPYRRAVALRYATELIASKKDPTPEERREAERRLDAIVALLPKSVASDPRGYNWEDGWYTLLHGVVGMRHRLGADRKTAFDRVDASLADVPGVEAMRRLLKGSVYIGWGWEARTNAFAADVSDEQMRTFETRIREARAALNAAWEAKPGEPRVATQMIEVEKDIGGGDRQAMETWFERAMKTDGNDYSACQTKLDWLDPKWYGDESGDEMMAFGKACRATGNWWSKITLLAADAHWRHACHLEPVEREAYLKRPEVWTEIQAVYDEYLKHCGFDNAARCKYATIGYFGRHYPEAFEQFQAVGKDNLATWYEYPNVTLDVLKQIRENTTRMVHR
jgi:hypothetical protein